MDDLFFLLTFGQRIIMCGQANNHEQSEKN